MKNQYNCKICREEISRITANYGKGMCRSCGAKCRKKQNKKKYYCIYCDKNEIGLSNFLYGNKRCWECFSKNRCNNKASNYKHGNYCKNNINSCIDCGKKITYQAKRCKKCNDIVHSKRMIGKKLNYDTTGKNNPNFKYNISKKFLIKEYIKNNKTMQQIADIIGCCIRPVRTAIKKWKISVKNHSERHIGKLNGIYNPNLTKAERIKERNYPDYRLWRTKVYERDSYTCRKCNNCNGNGKAIELNAHHIESYRTNPKLRTKLSNGITLCRNCHSTFHHRFGYGNNIEKQIKIFLKEVN